MGGGISARDSCLHYFIGLTYCCYWVCDTQPKSWGYLSSSRRRISSGVRESLEAARADLWLKANTRNVSKCLCGKLVCSLLSPPHTFVVESVRSLSFFEAHKFKQVSRKLHACHDNKTNCDDLWWGSERARFLWLDNICVEADLKRKEKKEENERLKLTLREKNDINFLSTRTSSKEAYPGARESQ